MTKNIELFEECFKHTDDTKVVIEKVFQECGISKIDNKSQIDDNLYYILPNSGDIEIFSEIKNKYHINYYNYPIKMIDILIKINDSFILINFKDSNDNDLIKESIEFIHYGERGVHYVSCLNDGLFNKNTLKEEIIDNLSFNPGNYYVNEYGLIKLVKEKCENNKWKNIDKIELTNMLKKN